MPMKKTILSLLVAVGLIGSAFSAVLPGDLANGLVAYYSFNGNANDSSGNGNNGTVYGATPTTDQFGNPNGALSFNGIDSYISTTASFSTGNAAKSFSVWFNPSVIKRGWVVDGGANIDGEAFGLFLGNSGGGLWLHANGQYTYDVSVGTITDPNKWYNAAVTYDGSIVDCYLNGTLTTSVNESLNTAFSGILIGSRVDPGVEQPRDAYFQGAITDLGIWNTALTSSQVSQLYSLQSVPEPSTYALFGLGAIGVLMVLRRRKIA